MDAEHWRSAYNDALAAGDVLKTENERLRADNERLRGRVEALEKVRIAATAFIQFDALEAALEEAAR